jgi:hypothetical protein
MPREPAIGAPWRPRLWADNIGHVLAVDHGVRSGGAFSERRCDSPVGRLDPLNVVELIPRKTALRMVDEQG